MSRGGGRAGPRAADADRHRHRRLRRLVSWIASNYWLVTARFPGIAEVVAGDAPVYQALREHYGVRLRYAWRSLVATSASSVDAELLDVPAGSPVMLREGVNIDEFGVPTLFLNRRMRGDRVKYVLRYDTT